MTNPRPHPIYHLDLSACRAHATAWLNGFPVAELHAPDEREVSVPINLYLVGTTNVLCVVVRALAPNGEVACEGGVRRFVKGDIVGPGAGARVTRVAVAPDQRSTPQPWSLRARFSTIDAPTFDDELLAAEPFDDRPGLVEYALHLRELVQRRERAALLHEVQGKIAAYARAYAEDARGLEEDLAGFFDQDVLTPRTALGFGADDLELSPCCGGRIWSVGLRGGRALFTTESNGTGGRLHWKVLVGRRDGRLAVMR